MYDIVFISYNEVEADHHWSLLKHRNPIARRVHGVKGIAEAHIAAAKKANTEYFWVVDADNIVSSSFDFSFKWDLEDTVRDRVLVYAAINSINGLAYGNGGIKLLPRTPVLEYDQDGYLDFTMSLSNHFHESELVASMTVIDSTPFEAWRAGFREVTKLDLGLGILSDITGAIRKERTKIWREGGTGSNAVWCRQGANDAAGCVEIAYINDFDWLEQTFVDKYRPIEKDNEKFRYHL